MTLTEELLKTLIKQEERKLELLKRKNESANSGLRDGMIIFTLVFGSYLIGSFLIMFFF